MAKDGMDEPPGAAIEKINPSIPRAHSAYPAAMSTILLVVLLTVLVVVTDGIWRGCAVLFLVALPTWWIIRTGSSWRHGMVGLLVVTLGCSSAAMSWNYAHERFGSFIHAPVTGNSDQLDFTAMAWTWMRYSTLGTTDGPPIKLAVTEFSHRQDPIDPNRLAFWEFRAGQPEELRQYSYRAPGFPLLLGTVWKLTGYQPAYAPLLNLVLLAGAVMVLSAGAIRFIGLAGGTATGLTLATASAPMLWVGQAMSETLTVFLMAVVVSSTMGVLRSGKLWWWPILGVGVGLLAVTKQVFIPVGLLYLTVVAALVLWHQTKGWRRPLTGVATGFVVAVGIVAPWATYNVNNTGQISLATGTAGWHDMAASYSRAYLDGEDRVRVRERHFARWEERTGQPLPDETSRALVGRTMWQSQLAQGAYNFRLPQLMAHKSIRSAGADVLGWLARLMALVGAVVALRYGSAADRRLVLALAAMPAGLLLFISLTIEAGSRLLVTTWVVVAAMIGLGVQVWLDRPARRHGRSAQKDTLQISCSP